MEKAPRLRGAFSIGFQAAGTITYSKIVNTLRLLARTSFALIFRGDFELLLQSLGL